MHLDSQEDEEEEDVFNQVADFDEESVIANQLQTLSFHESKAKTKSRYIGE